MFKVIFRLQATAGHEGVGNADGGSVSELCSDVELIILLQKTAVNDAENVLLVVCPILRRKLAGDFFKLLGKIVPVRDTIPLCQCRRYCVFMFLSV